MLDNNKFYRYYQLQPAVEAQHIQKVGRPTKHTLQTLKSANTVKRKLKHEDIYLSNIIKTQRPRQKTDRLDRFSC